MTNEDRIAQLERRIAELEGYLSQFESFKNFRKGSDTGTAAIATTIKPGSKGKTKGTRLSEDWQPSSDLLAWVQKAFPFVDEPLETAKFVDYWVARADKGAVKLDWVRTYRNWIRTASSSYRRQRETYQRPDRLDLTDAIKRSFD